MISFPSFGEDIFLDGCVDFVEIYEMKYPMTYCSDWRGERAEMIDSGLEILSQYKFGMDHMVFETRISSLSFNQNVLYGISDFLRDRERKGVEIFCHDP